MSSSVVPPEVRDVPAVAEAPVTATAAEPPPAAAPGPRAPRSDWTTLARLLPYLWRYRWRVGIAGIDAGADQGDAHTTVRVSNGHDIALFLL